MTNSEALEILRKEAWCRSDENTCGLIACNNCKFYTSYSDVNAAINVAIEALETCVMIEDDGK